MVSWFVFWDSPLDGYNIVLFALQVSLFYVDPMLLMTTAFYTTRATSKVLHLYGLCVLCNMKCREIYRSKYNLQQHSIINMCTQKQVYTQTRLHTNKCSLIEVNHLCKSLFFNQRFLTKQWMCLNMIVNLEEIQHILNIKNKCITQVPMLLLFCLLVIICIYISIICTCWIK